MSGRAFSERDLHLALDGELPDDEKDGFERWLSENPDMRAAMDRLAADRERLRSALAPIGEEPVPERFAALVADKAPPRKGAFWRRSAAAAAIFLLGGLAGYGLSFWTPPSEPAGSRARDAAIAEFAIVAHRIYAAEKLHVVEVGADQKDHLVGWLSKRIGTHVYAPDFYARQYSLVGGRLLPAGGRMAAQLMYQDHEGNRVSLYVSPEPEQPDTGFRLEEEDQVRAYYWKDSGYGFAVAGAIPSETLLEIANMAYRQMLADPDA